MVFAGGSDDSCGFGLKTKKFTVLLELLFLLRMVSGEKESAPNNGGSVNFFGSGNSEDIEQQEIGTDLTGQKSVKM
jgi:hypothetical protein